jgi:hypothetical protein
MEDLRKIQKFKSKIEAFKLEELDERLEYGAVTWFDDYTGDIACKVPNDPEIRAEEPGPITFNENKY